MKPAQVAHIMSLVEAYADSTHISSHENCLAARAAVEAALRDAPQSEGWVMLPGEPTQTMMQQGKHALYEESMGDFDASLLEIKATYRAMLAARPSAPTAVEPDDQRYQLLRRGQHWSVIDGVGDVLRGDDLDAAVDSILAARLTKDTP